MATKRLQEEILDNVKQLPEKTRQELNGLIEATIYPVLKNEIYPAIGNILSLIKGFQDKITSIEEKLQERHSSSYQTLLDKTTDDDEEEETRKAARKKKSSMLKEWKRSLNKIKQHYGTGLRNDETAAVYQKWIDEDNFMPRKFRPKAIPDETEGERKVREELSKEKMRASIRLMQIRATSQREKHNEEERKFTILIEERTEGQVREHLKEMFRHEVQLTMDKAVKDWQKSKEWLEQLPQREADKDKTRDRNAKQTQDHNEKQKKKKLYSHVAKTPTSGQGKTHTSGQGMKQFQHQYNQRDSEHHWQHHHHKIRPGRNIQVRNPPTMKHTRNTHGMVQSDNRGRPPQRTPPYGIRAPHSRRIGRVNMRSFQSSGNMSRSQYARQRRNVRENYSEHRVRYNTGRGHFLGNGQGTWQRPW